MQSEYSKLGRWRLLITYNYMQAAIQFDLAPFNFPLIVYVWELTGTELQTYLEDSLGIHLNDDAVLFIWDKPSAARTVWLGYRYIILIKKWDKSNADIGALAHEVHHLLNFILLDINEERKDNEWEAYFVQDTITKILYKLDQVWPNNKN